MPKEPKTEDLVFVKVGDGYLISSGDSEKLASNVYELKAYIEKLEVLVEKMKKYYE